MPQRNLKQERQIALIDRIYSIFDAVHTVRATEDIAPEIRAVIVEGLLNDADLAKSSLAYIDNVTKIDANEFEAISILPARVNLS